MGPSLRLASPPPRRPVAVVSHAPPAPALRVLHYMPTNFGMTGVETFIVQLSAAQRRAGLAPRVALDLTGRGEVAAACSSAGVQVHDLPCHAAEDGGGTAGGSLRRKLRSARSRLERVRALASLLRDADALHVHAVGSAGVEGMLAALLAAVPTVVTHHTTLRALGPPRGLVGRGTFWLERTRAAHVVAPYAAAADELVAAGVDRARARVIPFCVDELRFAGAAAEPAAGDLHLVMPARLCPGKGHDDLLAAVARVRTTWPRLRLTLIGEGPEREAIASAIERLGLGSAVALRARVPHHEMPDLLRRAHAVVLPSRMPGETFPLCLLEGMALGLPAIGTRWFGIPDIIVDGETGLLVEPGDVGGLAAAIERLIADPPFYRAASRAAADRVRALFTATSVAAQYARLYAPVVGAAR